MKKCLFTAALLCSCTLAFNQTRLSGKVTDETGEELIGATVKLMQLERMVKGTITDYDGKFLFKEIEQGMYDVVVSYTGFTTLKLSNIFVKARGNQKMDTIQLERIVETGCNLPGVYGMHKPIVLQKCEMRCCIQYNPPLININPGNTGTTYSGYFISNMY